jgi:hypothetical protein
MNHTSEEMVRMTSNEKELQDVDYALPILLAFLGLTILSWTGTLLWWVVSNPSDSHHWSLWGLVVLGVIVGIWWTQSGIRQMYALWKGRRRLTGIERRYYIWRVGYVLILITVSFGLFMIAVPDFVGPLFPPTIALAFACALCFLAGWLATSED